MAIKSVWIEEDCIACGTCEGICPEVFHVTDRSRVNEGVDFNDYEEEIKAMAEVYQMEVDKVKEMLPEKSVIQIKEDIAVKKAAEFVVNNAKEK